MDFPVILELNIPDYATTLSAMYDSIGLNMSGYIDDGALLHSEVTGTLASTKVGDISLQSDPSDDRVQVLQDKDGFIALLDDAYGAIQSVTLPAGATGVDWSMGRDFVVTLTQKTLLQMQNSQAGMTVKILAINKGTSNDIIWDTLIQWPGVPPSMPYALAGQSPSVLFTLRNIGGTIYGESQSQVVGLLSIGLSI